jgi:hypothetical protein
MTDIYTKCVLTVIVVAFVVLAGENLIRTALAQIGYARLQICDEQNCTQLIPTQQSVAGRTVIVWSVPVVVR